MVTHVQGIPPHVRQAAVTMLEPYCPGIDDRRLIRALTKADDSLERDLPEKLLRVSQVAELLNCHRAYVYELIKAGELPSLKIGERGTRVPASAIVNLHNKCEVGQ